MISCHSLCEFIYLEVVANQNKPAIFTFRLGVKYNIYLLLRMHESSIFKM